MDENRVNELVQIFREVEGDIELDPETRRQHRMRRLVAMFFNTETRHLVVAVVSTFIRTLSGELFLGLVDADAATGTIMFTHFVLEMKLVYDAYVVIKSDPISYPTQTNWQVIGTHKEKLDKLVEDISELFEHYKSNDILHDARLNRDKLAVKLWWNDCVYVGIDAISLMANDGTYPLPFEDAKDALGWWLYRQFKKDTTTTMVRRIYKAEDASSISKKIEDALLIWKRKRKFMSDKESLECDAEIATSKSMLFELRYKFPLCYRIGSRIVVENKQIGLAFIEEYSRVVEALVYKAKQFNDAALTQG